MLTAIAAVAAFGQGITFDGLINSGLGFIATDADDHKPQLRAFGVDSESQGYRFRLNGSAQNEERTVGARFRMQGQRDLSTTGYLSMPYLYGWVNQFDNKLYVAAGLVDDGTYATADWWYDDDNTEGLGLLVRAAPIDGLSMGVGAYMISQMSGGSNNMLAGGFPNFRDRAINAEDAKYTFNIAYTMPDVFRFGLSYRTKNKAAWSANDPDTGDYLYNRGNFEYDQLIGELRVLAVDNLTAVVVGIVDNLGDSDNQNITLSETFAFKANEQLNLGLNAVQFIYNRANDTDPSLLFNLWGSYAIDSIIPRLDLVYMMGGRSRLSTSDGRYHRKGFQERTGTADVDDDYSVFSVRPSVRFNVNSRTHIEIGNMLNFDSYSGDETASAPGYIDGGTDRISNVFYFDFRWSF